MSKDHRVDDRLFLESIIENIPDMIFVKDAEELRFLRFNKAGEDLLGIPREEMYGKNDYDFFPTEEADFFTAKDREVLASGIARDIPEEPIHTASGLRWLHTKKVPVCDASGRVLYLLGISADITEKKLAEEALREAQDVLQEREFRLRLLLQHFPGAVWTCDGNGAITSVAGARARELRLDPTESIGVSMPELRVSSGPVESLTDYLQLALAGETSSFQVSTARQVFECQSQPLDAPGEAGAIFIAVDVTERLRLEAERMESRIREAQRRESLGVLAGGIAHDFNNLLVSILGNANLALEILPEDASIRPMLRLVEAAAERAATLTNQMLIYAGRGRFTVEVMDLREVVREMVNLLRTAMSKKAKIVFDFADEPMIVRGDPAQLRQLIMNLVTNASEALEGETGTVEVSLEMADLSVEDLGELWSGDPPSSNSYVRFRVTDTGCGMDVETQLRIFDPFFSTKKTGHGLGLAAAQGIVRGHGGLICVTSEPTDGTSIEILLPSHSESATVAESARLQGGRTEGRILVVDDEPGVRDFARLVLERQGYQVEVARDGVEALEMLEKEPSTFDVVLLDLNMPRMGGLETLDHIREIRADLPVVLSSGYNEEESLDRQGEHFFTHFMKKPYRAVDLEDAIRLAGFVTASRE